MKPTVFFLEAVDPAALKLLPAGEFLLVPPGSTPVDYHRVRAIVTRGKGQVDRALIDRCPALEVIVRCGVGVNNIDVPHATERKIAVLNVPGVNAATVAEHTLGLMLLLVRGMYRLLREVKEGNWAYRDHYTGQELRGLTLGIIGRGAIGSKVGGAAGELGMQVRYAQRSPLKQQPDEFPLAGLLSSSDVLSLHVPLTEETRQLIDATALSQLKPGSFLINTARGEVVDAPALLEALENGHLAGYASDLLSGEGAVQRRLIEHPNVLITPHAASLTALTFREMSERSVQHLVDHFAGHAIPGRYRVN